MLGGAQFGSRQAATRGERRQAPSQPNRKPNNRDPYQNAMDDLVIGPDAKRAADRKAALRYLQAQRKPRPLGQ